MTNYHRIFIVGHPGAGKGLFAETIAKKLAWNFIDADIGIEAHVGKPLNNILGPDGTASYMNCQREVIEDLMGKSNIVVATDAPVLGSEDIQELLASEFVVYLKTSVPVQLERSLRNQVPLLSNNSYEDLLIKLHSEYDPLFEKYSKLIIDGDINDLEKQVIQVCNTLDISDNNVTPLDMALAPKEMILFHSKTHESVQLTHQQAVCLKYLSEGLSSKEIARKMQISYRTVETYLAQLKGRLGCQSSKDLIALYHGVP